jgi:anti-anti-sigma factor
LVIEGEIDLGVVDQLTWRLAEASGLCTEGVEFDAAGVTFIDCCALRRVDDARRQLERDGKVLAIVAASDRFRRVSELAGYFALATVHPEGLASCHGAGARLAAS